MTDKTTPLYAFCSPCRETIPPPPLLQVDGLIMPSLVELCAPHLVHALVIGATERDGRSKPNVEIAKIFERVVLPLIYRPRLKNPV
jgi:hypothetical protein